jgi:hypothetical protein
MNNCINNTTLLLFTPDLKCKAFENYSQRKDSYRKMTSTTSLGYYLVYCPAVMLASGYKAVKGLGHHDANPNAKRLHKEKGHKVLKVDTL